MSTCLRPIRPLHTIERAACRALHVLAALAGIALPTAAIAQTGTVTGTVTNAATAAPVPGGQLRFCTAAQVCTGTSATNSAGGYAVVLAPGTYYAFTDNFNTLGLINEIYDDKPCPAICAVATAVSTGTPIVVTAGGTVAGRNFALAPGGSVTGTVRSAATNAPLAGVGVFVYTRVGTTGVFAGSATTNSAGVYVIPGLPSGAYFAATSTALGYIGEIFDNILCPISCSSSVMTNSGHPIAVTAGAATANIDFALDFGGSITGVVTDNGGAGGTSRPLANMIVAAFLRVGTSTLLSIASAVTDSTGVYSLRGLPSGNYYVYTRNDQYINEVYNNRACATECTPNEIVAGDAVPVVVGSATTGRDIQLDPGGSIRGAITDAASGTPITTSTSYTVYRLSGSTATFVKSLGQTGGNFSIGGLESGSYAVLASPPAPYVAELFGGVQCPTCSLSDVLAATPIQVTSGAATLGRDIAVDAGGAFTGTVTDAATTAPLVVSVSVYNAAARLVGVAVSTADGTYAVRQLPPGTYFASTGNAPRHLNEIYSELTCATGTCTATATVGTGTGVPVTANGTTPGVNFTLAPSTLAPSAPTNLSASAVASAVQISWTAPTSGSAATSYVLEAGLSPGTTAAALPAASPSLSLPGVPAGTYYLRVRAVNAFGTSPASSEFTLVVNPDGNSTPLPPTALSAWTSGGRLTMTWTAPATGVAPSGYVLEAGSASGLSDLAVVPISARSFVFDPIPTGYFFLRVRSQFAAALSAPSTEMMINVGNVPAPPSAPLSLTHAVSASTLTLSWTAPAVGTATSYVVEAGTATGLSNIAVFDLGSASPTFSAPGVPPGTYYIRLRARNALGVGPVSNERTVVVP